MPSSDNEDFQPNNVWASSSPTGVEQELTTPTGQTCRAKKMSLEAMLSAGLLAESDAITAQVVKHIKKVSKKTSAKPTDDPANAVDIPSLMRDGKAIGDLVMMLDRIMPHIVVSPTVKLHFTEQVVGKTKVTKSIPIDDREPGIIYTDQIGLEDKMYIFDWAAGGLGAMLNFRE